MGDFGDNIIDSLTMWVLELLSISTWWFTRWMLIWARQIEAFRVWLVENVLWSAYSTLGSYLLPTLLICLMLGVGIWMVFSFFPGLMEHNPVRLKKAIPDLLLTGGIFAIGSQGVTYFLAALQFLGQFGLVFGLMFAFDASSDIPYMVNTDADGRESVSTDTASLYGPDSPTCPNLDTRRRMYGTEQEIALFHLNDATALVAGATTIDIHCPPTSQVLPALFRTGDGDAFEGYFPVSGDEFSDLDPGERREAITRASIGFNRLIIAAIMALGSNIEQLMMIIFVLGATATFCAMVASRLFSWFAPMSPIAGKQMLACGMVLWRYLLAFLWIGIFLGLTFIAFATSGNVFIGAGAAFLTLAVVCWQFWESRHVLGTVGTALTSFSKAVPSAMMKMVAGPIADMLQKRRHQPMTVPQADPTPPTGAPSPQGVGWKTVAAGAGFGFAAGTVAGGVAGWAASSYYNRSRHQPPPPPPPPPTVSALAVSHGSRPRSWATEAHYRVYKKEPTVIEGTVVRRSSQTLPERKQLPGGTTP